MQSPLDLAPTVADHTVRQVRTFLYNLANGTNQHAQIDSVTKQVTRQYQGRTAIELLQNAHDALRRGRGKGHIAFYLRDEGEHGALYVANGGRPVQGDEAKALAEIGLSSKSPATDVGNKGLGFRSVLDLSERPAVYSCAAEGSGKLDGHCLLFTPTVVNQVAGAATLALEGRPVAFLGVDDLLADWSDSLREALRQRGRDEGDGWIDRELRRLSPYALPIPARPTPFAEQLAADGYSTVVHLPLRSAEARGRTEHELRELQGMDDLGLFLDALRLLVIDRGDGEPSWELRRPTPDPEEAPFRRRTVTLSRSQAGVTTTRSFSVWSRSFGDSKEERAELQVAAAELPDDWSSVSHVTVDVAMEHVDTPPVGHYSIFLPTDQATGTGAFVNAPFYGELDRRSIAFNHDYNELLRREAVRLSASLALELAGRDAADAPSVVDLLAPVGSPDLPLGPDVWAHIEGEAGVPCADIPLLLSTEGWTPPRRVRVADLAADRSPLAPESLEALASFVRPHRSLVSRSERIRALLAACGIAPEPSVDERAGLVEAVAAVIPVDGDWDGFWEWAHVLCGKTIEPLRTRRVLLAGDGRRLALDGPVKVFFPPQMGAASNVPVPGELAGLVAFLGIPLPLRQQNASGVRARKALAEFESDLAYDAPALVRRVLLQALPDLPVPLNSPQGDLCAAVLRWAMQLYAERLDWGDLGNLPVPCRGGWQPASKAMFGPGWGALGEDLEGYLTEAATAPAMRARARIVVPPDHPVWGGGGEALADALQRIGVAHGLRLQRVQRRLELTLGRGVTNLSGGAGLPCWAEVRPTLRARAGESRKFEGYFDYETDNLWVLPGLDAFDRLSGEGRSALSRLILGSIDEWERRDRGRRSGSGEPSTWRTAYFGRSDGQPHRFDVPSPLALALQTLPWLVDGDRQAPPSDWWVLPPEWADGPARYRYAYLHPIPRAPQSPPGRQALRALGADVFLPDPERPPSGEDAARFLDAVADAADRKAASPVDLRSHARKGWEALPADTEWWPDRLVVEVGDSVTSWEPTAAAPCDLPPSSTAQADALRAASHPLVVIDPADASRLADAIHGAYDGGVRRPGGLRSVVLVEDVEWEGGGVPLPDSPLAWVVPVVLAAHAFSGTQTYGTATEAFARAHASLRSTRVTVAERLATQIDLGDVRTPPQDAEAWWDEATHSLLVRRGASARAVARPLARLVERRDLFYPLESALTTLDVEGVSVSAEPSAEYLEQVYDALGVDVDRRHDVDFATREDVAWLRERVLPVLILGGADPDAIEVPPSDDGIVALLRDLGPPSLAPEVVLDACRTSRSDADLGHQLYILARVPLSAWNEALARVGRPAVTNEKGPAEVARALDALRPLLRAALRHAAIEQGDPALYHEATAALAAASVDAENARSTWSPPAVLAADAASGALAGVSPEVAALAAAASTPADLRAALDARGADPADPEVLLHENRRAGRAASDALLRVWIAARLSAEQPPPSPAVLDRALDGAVASDGLSHPWTPVDARRAVAQHAILALDGGSPDPVLEAAASERDADELLATLGLTAADVEGAQAALDAQRDAERRRQRTINVAGAPFYGEDLDALWDHLQHHVGDDALSKVGPADLEPVTPKAPGPRRDGRKGPGVSRRAPQWRRDLVGLAGEILAYRALRSQYGADVVTPTAWKSGNRALAHGRRPEEADPSTDDAIGYDFEFVADGLTHQVEVKASEGDRPAFEMGESETRAARSAVGDGSVRYQILRVSDALSATPHIALLPNPFLPSSSGLFDVRSQGAVVYFQLSKD